MRRSWSEPDLFQVVSGFTFQTVPADEVLAEQTPAPRLIVGSMVHSGDPKKEAQEPRRRGQERGLHDVRASRTTVPELAGTGSLLGTGLACLQVPAPFCKVGVSFRVQVCVSQGEEGQRSPLERGKEELLGVAGLAQAHEAHMCECLAVGLGPGSWAGGGQVPWFCL